MQGRLDAVAIFLDEEELGQLFDGWPEAMRLAVCLDEAGSCAMLVHHRDEDAGILRRVTETLDRPNGEFCVVPARPGLPTRHMLFSEERKLMRLVVESTDLVEFATDYALNYRFAAEEGLDVEAMLTGRPRAGKPTSAPVAPAPQPAPRPEAPRQTRPEDQRPSPSAPPAAVRAPAPARAPSFAPAPTPTPAPTPAPAAPAGDHGLPEGFHRLRPEVQQDGLFAEALLSLGRPGEVRLTVGTPTPDTPGLKIPEIYFRNDLLSFAIPASALAGTERLPAKLVFDEALMPRAMVAALGQGPQAVRLTASGAHLFVGLPAPRASMPAVAAAARTLPAKRRRLGRRLLRGGLGGGALVAGVLLAVRLGLSPAFSGTDGPGTVNALRDAIFARIETTGTGQ
ncbi:hypothetical protein U879_09610 [Defluviimonas sp. 20V17]|uniref:Uncharacterized protein n=1 Tax=Allgaiera indica TaxID=765699 RepID=A0AAN4ZY69_9RHOB|nr:hypothetical protein [Allgaiera indica]KDB03934.1 hypothetical protein U879_09610 [Defluviimonas sp. 20V17]GHD99211.1 hypothetical protein GCM10008024_05680 [Allgaiera indica]SDW31290.1 hypothetical protein SAMN05444006_102307 [Allgaiera indica]